MTDHTIAGWDRIKLGFLLVVLWLYGVFEILEDFINEVLPFDDFMILGVAAVAYVVLFKLTDAAPKLYSWVVMGLIGFIAIVDWTSPSGSSRDEVLTWITILVITGMIAWPILKRVRLAAD